MRAHPLSLVISMTTTQERKERTRRERKKRGREEMLREGTGRARVVAVWEAAVHGSYMYPPDHRAVESPALPNPRQHRSSWWI